MTTEPATTEPAKTLLAAHPDRIDLAPRAVSLPDAPGPWRIAWTTRLAPADAPGRARLRSWRNRLFAVCARDGAFEVGADGPIDPTGERISPGGPLWDLYPSRGEAPVAVREDGHLSFWMPGNAVGSSWSTNGPGQAVEAIGTTDGQVLIQREHDGLIAGLRKLVPGDGAWTLEMVHVDENRMIWSRRGRMRARLLDAAAVYLATHNGTAVEGLDARTGRAQWQYTVEIGRVSHIIARTEAMLWCMDSEGGLLALDRATGDRCQRITLPQAKVPTGVVDPDGRLHVCTGLSHTIVDLERREIVHKNVWAKRADSPNLAFGHNALLSDRGALVFADRRGGVFTVRAEPGASPVRLWGSKHPVRAMGAAEHTIVALTNDGVLTGIRPE